MKTAVMVTVCLLAGSAFAQPRMTDREFFQCLNLDLPELAPVRQALARGDTAEAERALLVYYQNRTSVHYFALSPGGSISRANDNLAHYFEVNGVKHYAGAPDGTVDWTTRDPQDNEWHFQFHRMYWLVNLGKVYAGTKDEKYAREWVAELLDWSRDNPPGYPRTLDTGIRLRNWVESYQYFVAQYASPSVTPEAHVAILKSIIEQCRFLRDNWRSDGNWGAEETRGLGAAVTMFPEFKFTPNGNWQTWRDLVIFRLDHHLSGDFYPDGVQVETSPMYHSLEYRNLFLTQKLMAMNGVVFADSVRRRFIKPLEFMAHIHMPDGYLPQLSDTDRKSYLDRLKEGAEAFGRADLLYAATGGSQGTAPHTTFAAFPYGGYFVMRSSWGRPGSGFKESKYLVLDTGSNEPWHAHYDILNVVVYASGYRLIRDAGRYTYVSGSWRDYFKGTAAHNTVLVDGRDQARHAAGEVVDWFASPGFDFVAGRHHAYSGLEVRREVYFLKPDYWIFLDRITGTGDHSYDLNFHLDSAFLGHVTLDAEENAAVTPRFAVVCADSAAGAELHSGWVSNHYGSKAKAPVVTFHRRGTPPVSFVSVIYPFPGAAQPPAVKRLPVLAGGRAVEADSAAALEIRSAAGKDLFIAAAEAERPVQTQRIRLAGERAVLRFSSAGTLKSYFLERGSRLETGDTLLVDADTALVNLSYTAGALTAAGEGVLSLRVWAPAVDSLNLNGKNVAFARSGNYVLFPAALAVGEREGPGGNRLPQTLKLLVSVPNPFRGHTTIRFRLERSAPVTVRIYSTTGREVCRWNLGRLNRGPHSLRWNGRGSSGEVLASGVYFCRVTAGGEAGIVRMLLLH